MPTFSVFTSTSDYKNLTFLEALHTVNEYIAKTGDNEIPVIMLEETGEIVNQYIFFVDNEPYQITDLLELLPYIHRFHEIKTCFGILWLTD